MQATLDIAYVIQFYNLPPLRIPHRIPKHLHKHRLQIPLAQLQRVAAQPAQAVGARQDAGDALLFGEGRKRDLLFVRVVSVKTRHGSGLVQLCKVKGQQQII